MPCLDSLDERTASDGVNRFIVQYTFQLAHCYSRNNQIGPVLKKGAQHMSSWGLRVPGASSDRSELSLVLVYLDNECEHHAGKAQPSTSHFSATCTDQDHSTLFFQSRPFSERMMWPHCCSRHMCMGYGDPQEYAAGVDKWTLLD